MQRHGVAIGINDPVFTHAFAIEELLQAAAPNQPLPPAARVASCERCSEPKRRG